MYILVPSFNRVWILKHPLSRLTFSSMQQSPIRFSLLALCETSAKSKPLPSSSARRIMFGKDATSRMVTRSALAWLWMLFSASRKISKPRPIAFYPVLRILPNIDPPTKRKKFIEEKYGEKFEKRVRYERSFIVKWTDDLKELTGIRTNLLYSKKENTRLMLKILLKRIGGVARWKDSHS